MHPDLKPGLTFEWTTVVPERATVPNLFHDVPACRDLPDVLATGYMVGLMEIACMEGIMPYVDWVTERSVGTLVEFSHLAATPPGMTVTVRGEVLEVSGRRLRFRVEAWDGLDKISEGIHERNLISPAKFEAKLAEKKTRAGL